MLIIDGSSKELSEFYVRKGIVTFDPVDGFCHVICHFGVVFLGQSSCEVKIEVQDARLRGRAQGL